MGLSIVIPSKTAENFLKCAEAVRKYEPEAQIILIDDGIEPAIGPKPELMPYLEYRTGLPFNFSRNCNIGIGLAENDDVVLLNDDAILQTPGGLSLMQTAAIQNQEYGLIGAVTNNTGNRNQFPQNKGLRTDPRMCCFICVLIPRRTIVKVGLLDERYNCYSHQDDDYCYRVRQAGMKIGIHDGCYVDHLTLQSTFRGNQSSGGELKTGAKIFKEIHGLDPEYA